MPEHLDILLFGPAGAGKTSLIKTFYRSLHHKSILPEQIENVLSVKDRNSNEGTTKFTKVIIKPDLNADVNGDSDEESKEEQSSGN